MKSTAKDSLFDRMTFRGIEFGIYAKHFARQEILHEAPFFHDKAFNHKIRNVYRQVSSHFKTNWYEEKVTDKPNRRSDKQTNQSQCKNDISLPLIITLMKTTAL